MPINSKTVDAIATIMGVTLNADQRDSVEAIITQEPGSEWMGTKCSGCGELLHLGNHRNGHGLGRCHLP